MGAITNQPLWTAEDYGYSAELPNPLDGAQIHTERLGLFGTGAKKLASSAVAPLVAAARGYFTTDPAHSRADAKSIGLLGTTVQAKQLNSCASSGGDALVMPWFALSNLGENSQPVSSYQVRPAIAIPNRSKDGKPAKYVFLLEGQTVLDVHPSTPATWLTDTPRVMFVEGLLKADAALTALLLNHGVNPSDLAYPHRAKREDATSEARDTLRDLLDAIPADEAALIVGIAGVGNWHQNPDWAATRLRERAAIVAFDADLGTNYDVWIQASQLIDLLEHKKASTIQFIDLSNETTTDGGKCGVDDYLAAGHTWADLDTLLITDLPPQPEKPIALHKGEWRVNEEKCAVEECTEVYNPTSGLSSLQWETRSDIIGRIVSIEESRIPTDEEILTGVFDRGAEAMESTASVELSFLDNHVRRSAIVTGPSVFLAASPKDWVRANATIPNEILTHPGWPPEKPEKWLSAIKANRLDECKTLTSWGRMGWVPRPEGTPVFVVGDQVIGPDGVDMTLAHPGVSERVLAGASRFGAQFLPATLSADERRQRIMRDIRIVWDTYITNQPWTNPGVAAAVFSAAFRPCVPVQTRTVISLTGPPRKGKSFTASHIMSAWQAFPGAFSASRLPGAVFDTMASTEHAVARTPIWVMDDFAPVEDPRKAMDTASKLGDLIRSVRNGAGKRRMNYDMTSRGMLPPHAEFIITGENDLNVLSVNERLLRIHMTKGSLNPSDAPTDALNRLRDKDGAVARCVGYVIQYLQRKAENIGWSQLVEQYESWSKGEISAIEQWLRTRFPDGNSPRRLAEILADLWLGACVFADMASEYFGAEYYNRLPELKEPYRELIVINVQSSRDSAPGIAAVSAVSAMLRAGRAHIANPGSPGYPPKYVGADGDDTDFSKNEERAFGLSTAEQNLNNALGWRFERGAWQAKGLTVGYFVDSQGEDIILLDPKTAFEEARKFDPSTIQHGASHAMAWRSAWDEGLTSKQWKRVSNGNKRTSSVRLRAGGERLSGIPIPLDVLLAGGDTASDDDNEQEQVA